MKFIELSIADKSSYNNFVASQPSGSFLQSWEWGEWQARLGREVYRFKVIDDNGEQLASVQLIKMPLPFGRYYLYMPYGPVIKENFSAEGGSASGGQFSPPQADNFQFLLQELKQRFADTVFIRVEPKGAFNFQLSALNLPIFKSSNIQPGKTLVVDLRQSPEELLAGMHQKTRYNIRLAQRHGVEVSGDLIVVPGHGLYIKEALSLFVGTADRQNFQTFPRSYYQGLLDFFALQNTGGDLKMYLYKALFGRELLSAAVMIDFGHTRTYLFGGSAGHHREVMAPHALHFNAMLDAKREGLNFYDFWGIETAGGDTPGFVKFKMGFGGETRAYPGAYDIPQNVLWHKAYKTLRKINRAWLSVKALHKKLK